MVEPRDKGARSVTPLDQGGAMVVAPPNYQDPSAGIVQHTGADWFGPQNPQRPTAPPEVAGRRFDYQSGYNLWSMPRANEGVPFADLRALADAYDVLREVIETRKDQMARLQWSIVKRKKKGDLRDTGAKPAPADPRIEALEKFFRRPDGEHAWGEWLRMLLEDLFVLDAPTLWKERTRAGKLYALHPIDGATIKRVINDWARTPAYPAPAYQQALKGLPAVNYTLQDIIYRPRNQRTNRVYGYPPVEQIILTINIALRREVKTLQYFTEGNIPDALVGVPDSWTPDQIKAYQDWFDSSLTGQTGQQRHLRFVPGAISKNFTGIAEPELKNMFDEWLARVVCFAFSISPTPFISQVNRATAQSAKEASLEEGLVPTQDWVKQLIDDILVEEFAVSDLEFQWEEDSETDPKAQEEILSGFSKTGVMTLDESRERLGLAPYPNGAGAVPRVLTATGYVPVDAYAEQMAQQQANTEAAAARSTAMAGALNGVGGQKQIAGANEGRGKSAPAAGKPAASKGNEAGGNPVEQKEVGKSAAAPFAKAHTHWKRIDPVPYPRRDTRRAAVRMTMLWGMVLKRQGKAAAAAVVATLSKADDPRALIEEILAGLDLSLTDEEIAQIADDFAAVYASSGDLAFAQVASGDIFDQLNEPARQWAADNAAELVSQVEDSTRDTIRQVIADGEANGLSAEEIAASIEDATGFSSDRASLIADTEIANANSAGALAGYREAAAGGVELQKAWMVTDADTCDECVANEDASPIGLDEAFPSGDDAPLAHPRCRCAIYAVVPDDAADDGSDQIDQGDGE